MPDPSTLNPLRALPQVEAVMASPGLGTALHDYRREIVLWAVRGVIDDWRQRLAAGENAPENVNAEAAASEACERLAELDSSQLRRVINATGVLLHTNLGRSILNARARHALLEAAGGYCDLELNPTTGKRSQRDQSVEPLLCALTGAAAATVVNNCAAAVYLILHTLARRREVITSRGELVEIGGNFRVPDVVRASGCKLVEVGSTNRTRLSDYSDAIGSRTALLLKTHQSNYRIRGFTEETSLASLAGLARLHGLPLVFDAGSGLLSVVSGSEPSVPVAVADGADLVCFSGDKLLGGPQAGIICGSQSLIAKLRKSPLWRALRVDKLTLAALGATLAEALRQPGRGQGGGMPLLVAQLGDQESRARELARLLSAVQPQWHFQAIELEGSYGGGTLPDENFPGWAVALSSPLHRAAELGHLLRRSNPAVLGTMHRGQYCLHVAALLPDDAVQIAQHFKRLSHG